jgi:hypothetical protein
LTERFVTSDKISADEIFRLSDDMRVSPEVAIRRLARSDIIIAPERCLLYLDAAQPSDKWVVLAGWFGSLFRKTKRGTLLADYSVGRYLNVQAASSVKGQLITFRERQYTLRLFWAPERKTKALLQIETVTHI